MSEARTPNNTKFVRVDWEDISFDDNWGESDEPVHPKECSTWGFLVEENESEIILASSFEWQAGQWGTLHAISKAKPEVGVIFEPGEGRVTSRAAPE